MRNRALLGLPLVLLGSGCTSSLRVGPEFRSQHDGPVLEGRGTFAPGLGGADGGGTQLSAPLSFSAGRGLRSGEPEGTFETGLEWTSTQEVFGYRATPRVGVGLGHTSGSYLALRGGPLLMFSPPTDDTSSLVLTLEGVVGIGVGGDMDGHGVYGIGLSIGADTYPRALRIPSGRPLRDEAGTEWSGEAGLGRRTEIRLARELPRDDREREGLGYVRDGLQELASIASFERLALELALVGAPRVLVDGARSAARDEARHARQCFALASATLGRQVLSPALPPSDPRPGRTRSALAHESWFDGWLGEGRAAEVLFARARRAADPTVRRTLFSIACDEARHAVLGWNIYAWGAAEREVCRGNGCLGEASLTNIAGKRVPG